MNDEKDDSQKTAPAGKRLNWRLIYFIVAISLIFMLWLFYRYYFLEPMLKLVGK